MYWRNLVICFYMHQYWNQCSIGPAVRCRLKMTHAWPISCLQTCILIYHSNAKPICHSQLHPDLSQSYIYLAIIIRDDAYKNPNKRLVKALRLENLGLQVSSNQLKIFYTNRCMQLQKIWEKNETLCYSRNFVVEPIKSDIKFLLCPKCFKFS